MLNRHPNIFITTETHYFDDPRARLSNPASPSEIESEKLLDHFMRVSKHGYGLQMGEVTGPERKALQQAWAAEGPSADALFTAYCKGQSNRRGKSVWGEKTPRHLFRVDDIFQVYPDARVIICMRDPRAAVVSYRDWRNNWFDRETLDDLSLAAVRAEEARTRSSYSLTVTSLLWRSAAIAAQRLLETYGADRIFLNRYEDLVEAPEVAARKLTDWLNVSFTTEILQVSVVNSSYLTAGEASGVQKVIAGQWRGRISKEESSYIEWLTRNPMIRCGYQPDFETVPLAFAVSHLIRFPIDLLRILSANANRIGNFRNFILSRMHNIV